MTIPGDQRAALRIAIEAAEADIADLGRRRAALEKQVDALREVPLPTRQFPCPRRVRPRGGDASRYARHHDAEGELTMARKSDGIGLKKFIRDIPSFPGSGP